MKKTLFAVILIRSFLLKQHCNSVVVTAADFSHTRSLIHKSTKRDLIFGHPNIY